MAKGKKDEVVKTEVGAPVEQTVTAQGTSSAITEVEIDTIQLVNVEKLRAKIAEVEKVAEMNEKFLLEKLANSNMLIDQLNEKLAQKPILAAAAGLTEEQEKSLKFCLQWVADIRRRSRSVPFRQEAQEALSTLSQLLS